MAFDEGLASRVRSLLADRPRFTERKMFGGLGFMLGGNMCCGIHQDALMVRVPANEWENALAEPHARPMEMPGRPPMRGFVLVDPSGLKEDAPLRAWVERGAAYAASLPPK